MVVIKSVLSVYQAPEISPIKKRGTVTGSLSLKVRLAVPPPTAISRIVKFRRYSV